MSDQSARDLVSGSDSSLWPGALFGRPSRTTGSNLSHTRRSSLPNDDSSSSIPFDLSTSPGFSPMHMHLAASKRRLTNPFAKPLKSPKDLLMSSQSVVKNRSGSVLSKQIILKSDQFDSGVNAHLDFHLQGAPNFRMADLNVFGVAQPTVTGITTILTLLGCDPGSSHLKTAFWFSAREEPMIYINRKPFVIRDATNPTKNIKSYQGISAARLEQVEDRLKEDVFIEEHRSNGLLLVHEETHKHQVFPSWIAIDKLETPRQVFEGFIKAGFKVQYVRIPISPEQAPEDQYIDGFVESMRNASSNDPLVFNCGMGVGRTTFAMVIAMVIRRGQAVLRNLGDPFLSSSMDFVGHSHPTATSDHMYSFDESHSRPILRLVYVLEQALQNTTADRDALQLALCRGVMLDDLRNAICGNYQIILQLLSVLSDGQAAKNTLDQAIDRCGVLTNLREDIFINRIKYSLLSDTAYLERACGCLERYFFLLAFCSYVNENQSSRFECSFSTWLKSRPEIWNMLVHLRSKSAALSLALFRPIDDLSLFSRSINPSVVSGWGPSETPFVTEIENHVIKARKGAVLVAHTILKEDHWYKESSNDSTVKGAPNFRKIPDFPIYAVAQPTLSGIKNVLESLDRRTSTIIWINLREEPLVYINGIPYVLRDQYLTLRNIKSYSGITAQRLELIESKLKKDVFQEIDLYKGKVLLHSEILGGDIKCTWEDCTKDHVLTPSEAMSLIRDEVKKGSLLDPLDNLLNLNLSNHSLHVEHINDILYFRVPTTAESPPDSSDLDQLVQLLSKYDFQSCSIILNCQIGLGRSTTGTVITSLILRWLTQKSGSSYSPPTINWSVSENKSASDVRDGAASKCNYHAIHSLLRVIQNGLESKRVVDDTIDNCGLYANLRDSIEECRQLAEAASSDGEKQQRRKYIKRGLLHLNRYFTLILFQNYLDQNEPGVERRLVTFTDWLHQHPEFSTIRDELETDSISPLVPVQELEPGDGIALSSEVLDVVNKRNGAVLAQGTIIKYDVFPGAQKLSLAEKIEGAHNFRRIQLSLVRASVEKPDNSTYESPTASWIPDATSSESGSSAHVYGVGMPSKDGIRRLLMTVKAGPNSGNRTLFWTSMREEPVIYVKGKPYVLRLFQDPLRNLEATGIARERVELMEKQMKREIIADMQRYKGRLLLHEEQSTSTSQFHIIPVWESVKEEDIETPSDVYESIRNEGYRVDYLRLPVTDEQAPIPDVFDQLVERLLSIGSDGDALFNCQMGRGRTTTGIVITCLMQMIVGNTQLIQNEEYILYRSHSGSMHSLSSDERLHDSEVDLHERLKLGEYKLVMQLIGVLQYGKLAKALTDQAIDVCDHMQNLRIAIYDYRLRVMSADEGTRKFKMLFEVACNYLVRYFFLVTFADYLIEVWSSWSTESLPPRKFSEWLGDRKEILNIIRNGKLSLD